MTKEELKQKTKVLTMYWLDQIPDNSLCTAEGWRHGKVILEKMIQEMDKLVREYEGN